MMNEQIKKLETCAVLIKLLRLLKILKKKKKSCRRWWVRPHLSLSERNMYGTYSTLFKYFALKDHEEFKRFVNMNFRQFNYLFELVGRHLVKQSRRPSLPPMLRLAAVLHYLAHGSDIATVAYLFRISREIMYRMVNEVCSVIHDVLLPIYVPFPNEQKWLEIVRRFWNKWQFPNCIGALDGKHFRIDCPPKSGTMFFNYKKFFSIVMIAVCDADKKIIWFNIGDYGSCSDPSIFSYTDLYLKMRTNDLNIPEFLPLPHTNINLPVAFITDEIFKMNNHLMKPYSRRLQLNYEQKIFNYRLKRARLTIECTFGILTAKFRLLRNSLKFNIETSKRIVAATVCLHNYILTSNATPEDNKDVNNINEIYQLQERMSPWAQRDLLAQYFVAPVGALPYQNDYI